MGRKGQAHVFGASNGGVPATNWFGNATDGNLHIASDEVVELEVVRDSGQIIKHYDNLTIDVGGVLKPQHRCNGMILLVRGNIVLNGTITVDKMAPCLNDDEEICKNQPYIRILGDVTGGNGGKGGTGQSRTGWTQGGNGGLGFWCGGGNGGGGGGGGGDYYGRGTPANGSDGVRPHADIGLPYSTPDSITLISSGAYGTGGGSYPPMGAKGGAAPGGGGASSYDRYSSAGGGSASLGTYGVPGRAGDAYGGGGLWIYVKGSITIGSTGIISADGGNGGNGEEIGSSWPSGSGGGGGGGVVALIHNGTIENNGSIRANGGNNGTGGVVQHFDNTSTSCAGSPGSVGTVIVKTLDEVLHGSKDD